MLQYAIKGRCVICYYLWLLNEINKAGKKGRWKEERRRANERIGINKSNSPPSFTLYLLLLLFFNSASLLLHFIPAPPHSIVFTSTPLYLVERLEEAIKVPTCACIVSSDLVQQLCTPSPKIMVSWCCCYSYSILCN